MNSFSQLSRIASALAAAALLSACASTPQLDAQWTDPSLGTLSSLLRSARVLVACDAFDVAVRQVCQDQLASEVVALEATPVFIAANT